MTDWSVCTLETRAGAGRIPPSAEATRCPALPPLARLRAQAAIEDSPGKGVERKCLFVHARARTPAARISRPGQQVR